MATPGKDPNLNELLDRIVRLENQNAKLRAQFADLDSAFDKIMKSTGEEVVEIHGLLWPLVYKVFPGFAADQKRIDVILKNQPSPEGKGRVR